VSPDRLPSAADLPDAAGRADRPYGLAARADTAGHPHSSRRMAVWAEPLLRLLGAGLLVAAAIAVPREHLVLLLQFLCLAAVARALRVPFDGTTLELEAAAIFPAVLLSRSWEAGVALAAASALATRLFQKRGRLDLDDVDDGVDLVLAYGASSYFFVSLSQGLAGGAPMALLFGGTLLVFFFARVVLGAVHAAADPRIPVPALVRAAAYQFFALVLLSPVVALVLMVYPQHGIVGTVLAFTSVALVSASLRNVAQARRRTAELARQNRELATLREVSRLFASAAPDEQVYDGLYRTLKEAFEVRAMAAASYEEETEGRAVIVLRGEVELKREAFADWLSRQRDLEAPFSTPSRAPAVAIGEARSLALNRALPYQVLLPLQTPEIITGVVMLESHDAALADPGALKELSVIGDHVALSLQDRNLRRQMQTVNERLESRAETLLKILEVSNELKSHLSLDQVLLNIVRAVRNSLGFNVVLLSLYVRQEDVFERRAQVGLDGRWEELTRERPPKDEVLKYLVESFRISKSYFVDHAALDALEDAVWRRRRGALPKRAWHAKDLILVPLTSSDQVVGVLQVDQPKSGLVPRLEDFQALEIFANQAVTAIQSARAYETTRQMSVKDSLTQAFNHRHFQETLHRELMRHERNGQSLALLMIDLDDFKGINDRWGHPVGDLVLRGLVDELLKAVREVDTVARYGGEEFALVLPDTHQEAAAVVAERIRSRVESRLFVTPDVSHPLSVTVSIGIACYPQDAQGKREVIERADQALYQAKRTGKNRVVLASLEN